VDQLAARRLSMGERLGQRPMLYQSRYVWFVFLSAMDVMMTWIILSAGGRELNWIANAVIEFGGKVWLIGYKMAIVVLVIMLIETIGRMRASTGRQVATAAIAITAFPVVFAFGQILLYLNVEVGV
jgi:hypothetical protein